MLHETFQIVLYNFFLLPVSFTILGQEIGSGGQTRTVYLKSIKTAKIICVLKKAKLCT